MQQPPLPTTTTNMATGASPLRYVSPANRRASPLRFGSPNRVEMLSEPLTRPVPRTRYSHDEAADLPRLAARMGQRRLRRFLTEADLASAADPDAVDEDACALSQHVPFFLRGARFSSAMSNWLAEAAERPEHVTPPKPRRVPAGTGPARPPPKDAVTAAALRRLTKADRTLLRAAARSPSAAAEMQAAEAACRALLWEYLALRAQADTDAAAAREWEEAAAEPTLCAATLTPTAVDDDDDGGWEVVSSADKAGEEVAPPSPSAASTASSFVSVGPDGAAPLAPSPHRAAHTVARTKDPQRRHARNRRTGGGGGGSGGGRSGVSTERHLAAWDALTTVVGDCRAAHSRPVLRALARFYRLVPSDRLLAPAPPEGGHVVRVVARVAASTPRREVTDLAGVSLTAALGGGGGGAATAHASLEGGSTGAASSEPPMTSRRRLELPTMS